jgi:hypothetical protein
MVREGEGEGVRGTFTTWLYVANGEGVDEKLRAIERVVVDLGLVLETSMRTEGIKNLRRSETAIVCCSCRDVGPRKQRSSFPDLGNEAGT